MCDVYDHKVLQCNSRPDKFTSGETPASQTPGVRATQGPRRHKVKTVSSRASKKSKSDACASLLSLKAMARPTE